MSELTKSAKIEQELLSYGLPLALLEACKNTLDIDFGDYTTGMTGNLPVVTLYDEEEPNHILVDNITEYIVLSLTGTSDGFTIWERALTYKK